MARIGTGVNASLGAVDYSSYLKGSVAGSEAIGRGIAALGAGAGAAIDRYQKTKQEEELEKASSLNSQLNSIMGELKKDILKQVADDNKSTKETLDQALKSLGFIKKAIDQSPRKGTPHQDYVGEVLERFAGSVDNVTNVSAVLLEVVMQKAKVILVII